jgi:flagellar export protein FliJ
MAFRFPLKALQRLRAIYEQREGQRLAVFTHQLVTTQKQLAALKAEELEEAGSLAKSLQQGMTGAEVRFRVVCAAARLRRIKAVTQLVESLSRQREGQLAEYRQARRNLEIITRLYERQLAAYRRTQARRDQQQATDMFLIRSQAPHDGQ